MGSFAEDALAALIVVVLIVVAVMVAAYATGVLLAVAAAGFEWGLDLLGVAL